MSGLPERAAVLPALVADAQRGDRESFGRIFDTFQLQVYRYVLARIRSPADAEDVAAETFAAAFRTIGRFRWQGLPFEAWLFRIARSKIVDHQRRMGRRPTVDIVGISEDHLPRTEDVVNEVIRRQEHALALAALAQLSQDQQDVVALRFFAGLSVKETAGVMGRSPSAVRQLQLRAVTSLRRRLEVTA